MRILTALTYYRPHWTGLTVYAAHIAEGLAARGHEVTVVAAQSEPDLPRREVLDGVTVVRVPTVGRLSRAAVMPGFVPEVRRLLRDHDLLHLHSPLPEAGLLVALARRAGVPSAITHQGDVVMPAGAANRLIQGAMHTTLTAAVRRADAVITHNRDYAERSTLLSGRAARVHAIPPPAFLPEPDLDAVTAWRDELGLTGHPVVGFAGRFVEEKGFDVLLRAVPAVRAARPEVRFVFAGDSEIAYERTATQAQALLAANDDVVTSVGLLLDRQRLADFYRMLDLFVLPSRTDCHPAVQVEALLAGTPLLTTDIPGARSVVRATGMGRLVPADDPAALAEGILASLDAPRPRPTRAEVHAHYDPEQALDRYEALFDGLAVGAVEPAPLTSEPVSRAGRALSTATARDVEAHLARETDMAYRRRLPRMLELLEVEPSDVVLDAGCGRAAVTNVLAAVAPARYLALDGELARLEEAAREAVPAALVHGDLEHLPLRDESVDKVLCSEVLEHLNDDEAGAAEVARVLRPGGLLVVSVPHAAYPATWDPVNRARENVGLPHLEGAGLFSGQWAGHERLYVPAQLRALLEGAGFTLDALEEQTSHVLPFSHLLVYGIGRPLVEHGLLPRGLRRSADRFRDPDAPPPRFDPVGLGVRAMRRVDRRNDAPTGDEDRWLTIVARARKAG